jgi:hypothetical protein
MRRDFIACSCIATAWRHAPWASTIAPVDGGFIAFESIDDFRVWSAQRHA